MYHISSVYSPFSNRVGIYSSLHSFFRSVNEEYWSRVYITGCPSWRLPHACDTVSNRSKHYIVAGTRPIQLYIFVCTITQKIAIQIYAVNRPLVANRDHLYPDSLLFVSTGFLPRVSSMRLN